MFQTKIDNRTDSGSRKTLQMSIKLWEDNFPWSLKMFKITFLYPFQNEIVQILGNITLCSCLLLLLFVTILKLFKEKENGIEGSTLVEIIFQLTACTTMTILYILLICSKKNIYMSAISMTRMWSAYEDVQEMRMEYLRKGYFLSNFQAGSILLLIISFGTATVAIPPFLTWALPGNRTFEKTLPLHTEFFVDENIYFYPILAAQIVFLFIYGLLIVSLNYYLCWAVMCIISEFRCLEYLIQNMNNVYNVKMAVNEENANTWICGQLKDLVRMHQICIDFYHIIGKISDPLMFTIFNGTGCMIVLTGTSMVILVETDLTGAAKMLFAFFVTLFAIIFICIPSQLIKIASEDYHNTCFELSGQIRSPKIQKMLLFIIMRSMKPFVLTAGPTIELNLETCSTIIKTSMSYVTALRSVYN